MALISSNGSIQCLIIWLLETYLIWQKTLNNTDLNCVGPLICGFLKIVNTNSTTQSQVGWNWIWSCKYGGKPQVHQFSCSSCLTPCDPMDCSTPGFPVHHQLPEPTQTHVHPTISSSVHSTDHKLWVDFQLWGGSVSLTSALLKGQLLFEVE